MRTGVNIANVNSPEHKAMMDAYDEGTRKATPAKEEPPPWPQPLPDAADVGVVPSGTESLDATGFDDDFDSSFDNDFFDNDFVLMLPNIAARFTYRNRQASYPTRW
eukprot:COSAG05_NODE_1056_length_6007_cov_5.587678_1_plen_106_part_00